MLKKILLLPFTPFIIAGKAWWKFLGDAGVERYSGFCPREYKPPTTRIGKALDRFTVILMYAPCYFVTTLVDGNVPIRRIFNREDFGYYKKYKKRMGFTIVESAIVLVIIGLIVGGIVVGKEILQGAQLRATISQYDQFQAATNTFKLKYDGLPGDLERSKAIALGFPYTNATNAANNGNGMIIDSEHNGGTLPFAPPSGEVLYYWRYLSVDTRLIPGEYNVPGGVNPSNPANPSICCSPAPFLPVSAINQGAYWVIGSNRSENFFGLMAIDQVASNGGFYGNTTRQKALTPAEAFSIDSKIDDGMPHTGRIQARGELQFMSFSGFGHELTADLNNINASTYAATPVAGTCTTGGASSTDITNRYATNAASGGVKACNLRLKLN